LAKSDGLHSMDEAKKYCGDCHFEHKGSAYQPVNETAFLRMGIEDPDHFDHANLDFQLVGAHATNECSLCHENAKKSVLEPDQTRFLGLRQECVACHEDKHEGAMGADCASCHGQELEWKIAPLFEHTERFALAGVHQGLACAECHGGEQGPEVALLMEAAPEDVRACAVCHESPHAEPFAQATPESCADCHSTEEAGWDHVEESLVRSVHDQTTFALIGAHTEVACAKCHGTEAFAAVGVQAASFTERHPGRKDCAECHADPHGNAFDRGTLAEVVSGRSGCVRCHSETALTWAPVEGFEHGVSTGFELQGAHEAAECEACHKEADGRRLGGLIFPGHGDRCSECHEDPHSRDGRGSVAADLRCIGFQEGDCASCHNQVDFKEVPDFDHALSGWPLEGAHARTECAECHGAGSDQGLEARLGLARAVDAAPDVRCA
ncbi:MAG: hypothetical protein KDB61_13140, partial [Planctomycetes bacterium]|nr:hypothetical protein [Planctomycetota bacterium]